MGESDHERGRWEGKIQAAKENHEKRIARLETSFIAAIVLLAMESAEKILSLAGLG